MAIDRTNTMISGSGPFPGKTQARSGCPFVRVRSYPDCFEDCPDTSKCKPIVTVTPPLNTMPAGTQKAVTEMAGKAAEQLLNDCKTCGWTQTGRITGCTCTEPCGVSNSYAKWSMRPPLEPDRKKDFNGWCEFHKAEIVSDYEKLPSVDWVKKWAGNDGVKAKTIRDRFGLSKQGKPRVKKPGIALNPKFNPDNPAPATKLHDEPVLHWVSASLKLPELPEYSLVPDDCKAKWFEIYGKLIEGK